MPVRATAALAVVGVSLLAAAAPSERPALAAQAPRFADPISGSCRHRAARRRSARPSRISMAPPRGRRCRVQCRREPSRPRRLCAAVPGPRGARAQPLDAATGQPRVRSRPAFRQLSWRTGALAHGRRRRKGRPLVRRRQALQALTDLAHPPTALPLAHLRLGRASALGDTCRCCAARVLDGLLRPPLSTEAAEADAELKSS